MAATFIKFRKYLWGACFGSASLLSPGVRLEKGLTNGNKALIVAAPGELPRDVRTSNLVCVGCGSAQIKVFTRFKKHWLHSISAGRIIINSISV